MRWGPENSTSVHHRKTGGRQEKILNEANNIGLARLDNAMNKFGPDKECANKNYHCQSTARPWNGHFVSSV